MHAPHSIFIKKENYHVRNNFDRRFGFAVTGCASDVASQPTVGLLSEWRAWPDTFDSDHLATAGPDLGGRNVRYHVKQRFSAVQFIDQLTLGTSTVVALLKQNDSCRGYDMRHRNNRRITHEQIKRYRQTTKKETPHDENW